MAIGLAALGLLAFLLGCSGNFFGPQNSERAEKCFLDGTWVNEKGAKIVISENNNGVFRGSYLTALGATDKTIPPLPLQGTQHLGCEPIIAFIMKWKSSASVFVGQCFLDENGEEQLKTAWLLRVKLESAVEDWKGTKVGTDTFKRIK